MPTEFTSLFCLESIHSKVKTLDLGIPPPLLEQKYGESWFHFFRNNQALEYLEVNSSRQVGNLRAALQSFHSLKEFKLDDGELGESRSPNSDSRKGSWVGQKLLNVTL